MPPARHCRMHPPRSRRAISRMTRSRVASTCMCAVWRSAVAYALSSQNSPAKPTRITCMSRSGRRASRPERGMQRAFSRRGAAEAARARSGNRCRALSHSIRVAHPARPPWRESASLAARRAGALALPPSAAAPMTPC